MAVTVSLACETAIAGRIRAALGIGGRVDDR